VDMTAEFTSRFGTGATGTFRYGIYLDYAAAMNFTNVSVKLYITYDYDDTAHSTRVKTVRIPIESLNGRLSDTAQIIRQGSITNQIPALDTFLPEASKTYRQITAELWSNTLPSAATAVNLLVKLDTGGAETTYGTMSTLLSPICVRFFFDLNGMTTNASHDLYARHSAATQSHFLHIGGWVIVTYEYDHANSSTIMNSLLLGLAEGSANVRLLADKDVFSAERYIQEPETITLQQSGVYTTYNATTTSTTLSFGVGSQTVTGYTPTGGATMAGMGTFVHRVDSGGYRGAGISLVRGLNTFTTQWYAANVDRVSNVSCMLILNYTSGKHSNGDGVHAHSVNNLIFANNRAAGSYIALLAARKPTIIEPNYYLTSVMPILYATGFSGTIQSIILQAKILAGESTDAGYSDLFVTVGILGNERQSQIANGVCRTFFRRWPLDTDSKRLDIEGDRQWRISGLSAQRGLSLWITYHSISYTISGTVRNYTGDGSGITVEIYRTDNDELIGSVTTAVGGTYSLVWYDNVNPVYAHAIQDSAHTGRSINAAAV